MGGACGQGEVGWRRRTDRPRDAPRGRAGGRQTPRRRHRCPFRLLYAQDRCFAGVKRLSNAQETPRKQLEPAGTKLVT
eukprot:5487382-Prymnesium_polylepis.1